MKNTIVPISILHNEFNSKLENISQKHYKKIISNRTLNEIGFVKASELLIEITRLSSHFVSQKVKDWLSESDVFLCAYYGWKLAHEVLLCGSDHIKTKKALTKYSKKVYSQYKACGIDISLADISGLIFYCALIKEQFYKEFQYELFGIFCDGDNLKVTAAFKRSGLLKKPNKL